MPVPLVVVVSTAKREKMTLKAARESLITPDPHLVSIYCNKFLRFVHGVFGFNVVLFGMD